MSVRCEIQVSNWDVTPLKLSRLNINNGLPEALVEQQTTWQVHQDSVLKTRGQVVQSSFITTSSNRLSFVLCESSAALAKTSPQCSSTASSPADVLDDKKSHQACRRSLRAGSKSSLLVASGKLDCPADKAVS